jgi:glutamate N-acetyltransferase / amino-acid N-acetyltransferase
MSTNPKGFLATGVAAGLKSSGLADLALIQNVGPLKSAAAVFTKNRVIAAPVVWSKQVIKDGQIEAVLLNSGGANACTGPEGFADTHKSAEILSESLEISSSNTFICSTGLIGVRLPMEKIESGIGLAVSNLKSDDWDSAATAIMTTDSKPKIVRSNNEGISFIGIAKGAGMLAPSLATMLCVLATDAVVEPDELKAALEYATEQTFDRIDSDGCTSTNDTVLVMASGSSGVKISLESLKTQLVELCASLAHQLISDAEGHTKIIAVRVMNAVNESDAVSVGRACARNNLLKCAIFGEDANWGRILAAVGTTDAIFDPADLDVSINGVMISKNSAPWADRALVDMTGKDVSILIDLKSGKSEATVRTNDLSTMYVHENSAYSS